MNSPLKSSRHDPVTREMTRLYLEEGMTLQQIADRYGVNKQAVHYRLDRSGVSKRPLKHTEIDKKRLEKLYAKDISLKEIARRMGVYQELIIAALEFHKIPKRSIIKSGGKYTAFMRTLAVGEISEIDIDSKAPQAQLHRAAGVAEIKISVRFAGAGKFKVRRIS